MFKKHPFIKKNDKVIVLSGKEKGKIGSVLKVDSEKGRAIVEEHFNIQNEIQRLADHIAA